MASLSIIVAATNITTALLMTALMLPLTYSKVPRNRWYGFRFTSTLQTDEAWYAVNRYGARWMIIWSVGLLAFGIGCLFMPLENEPVRAILAAGASLVLVVPAVQSWFYAKRYREE